MVELSSIANVLRAGAAETGWHVIALPAGIATKTALLDAMADAGQFPEWAGRNWDALEDLLTDFAWVDPTPTGYIVLWPDADALTVAAPADAQVAAEILTSVREWWSDRDVPFIVLRQDGSTLGSKAP